MTRARILAALFALALAYRALCVFYYHPLKHIFSDPARHWLNGVRFFTPDFMGSMDPWVYQAWVHAVYRLGMGDPERMWWVAGGATALLSAAMPYFWYRALRELLPRVPALTGGIVIAVMPSLTMIYSYFMNETLLLTLMALGFWLTLRGLRKGTAGAFTLAAAVWALAVFTRMAALPVAGMCLAMLLIYPALRWTPGTLAKALAAIVCFGILLVPACWHSAIKLHYCAPFGGPMNAMYRYAQTKGVSINVLGEGRWGFVSPAMLNQPFAPFSDWRTPQEGSVFLQIDPKRGKIAWQEEQERLQGQPRPFTRAEDFLLNAVKLFFDPSWPDNNRYYALARASIETRWLWLPLLVVVAVAAWRRRRAPLPVLLIPAAALVMAGLLLIQTMTPMEGRYRKPLEPLLLASLAVLWGRKRGGGQAAVASSPSISSDSSSASATESSADSTREA